jgi:hypothetical protein
LLVSYLLSFPPSKQRNARTTYDDDGFISIHVAGADVTGPLLFLVLMGGGYYAYATDLYGRLTGKTRQGAKGKWVYDRSLGGKKVSSQPLWLEPPYFRFSSVNFQTEFGCSLQLTATSCRRVFIPVSIPLVVSTRMARACCIIPAAY